MSKEKDLRRIVKRWWGEERCYWVEWAKGATPGIPDVMVTWENVNALWLELKSGEFCTKPEQQTLWWESGLLRPEQHACCRRLHEQGVGVGVLIQDTRQGKVFFTPWWDDPIGSVRNLAVPVDGPEAVYRSIWDL